VLVALSASGIAATSPASKPSSKAAAKAAAKAPAGPQKLRGKQETLACRLGTEDRHARIAVVLIGGKTDSFAYYSKWKPRTCSIYLQRWRDSFSKWDDNGALTTVSLERGAFLIEHKKNEYHFIFRDIDRERYCGMDGVINGSLTIKKGNDQCQLDGEIMVEGTPLGQAFVNREEDKPPSGLMPDSVPASAATAVPDVPEKSATALVKSAAPAEQQLAPAAPTTTTTTTPAAGAAPLAAEGAKPDAAQAAPAKAEAAKEGTSKAAAAAGAEAAKPDSAKAEAPKPEPQKAAEGSSGGLRNFFRSFSQTRPAEPPPGTP
jgi:hypothetical protein